jgi:hypothetical protein
VTGDYATDEYLLGSTSFEAGEMKVSRVRWCTAESNPESILTALKLFLKKESNDYEKSQEIGLTSIGVISDYCQSVKLDAKTHVDYI